MNAVISSTSTKIIKRVGDQLHESGIEIYLKKFLYVYKRKFYFRMES
jgi:hypothetical protein